jgi:hypothetical protein
MLIGLFTRNPSKRPYAVKTPDGIEIGSIERDKSIIIVDKSRDAKIKDKNGKEIITAGSVPEIYFEETPLNFTEVIEKIDNGERQIIIEV